MGSGKSFDPFLANAPMSSENARKFWFSDIFRGYKIGTLVRDELKEKLIKHIPFTIR